MPVLSFTASTLEQSVTDTANIKAKKPAATVESVAAAIAAVDSGVVGVGDKIARTGYYSGSLLGANSGIVKEVVSRPPEQLGVITYCDGDKYIEWLFEDGIYRATQFGAGRGIQAEDTAACQAIVDAGLPHCHLDDNDEEYEILGVTVPQGSPFYITGDSKKAIIAARGAVCSWGDVNTTTSIFEAVKNIRINIYADCIDGIFSFDFCRNVVVRNVFVYTQNQTYIGTFAKLDRSYQFAFYDVHGVVKGFSMYELGDSTGLEVLDTVTIEKNCVWHSNYGVFTRDGALNIHNINIAGKFRDFNGSDEDDGDNVGETFLTSGYPAGATSITVTDSTVLNNSNLAANDLLYIGVGHRAEQVRVASVSGNNITLDTPLRFFKLVNEPVIFGCVYITVESVLSLIIPQVHFEGGYIGVHAKNVKGLSQSSAYFTAKNLYRLVNSCRGWSIGPVTYGNRNWDTTAIINIPSYHDAGSPCRNIKIAATHEGDAAANIVVAVNNSAQSTESIVDWDAGTSINVNRTLSTTINTKEAKEATIVMNGRIDNLILTDGVVSGQQLTINFIQDATGNRNVVATTATMTTPLYLSSGKSVTDVYKFRWDGSVWSEKSRMLYDSLLAPYVSANIADITSEFNTRNKYQGKQLVRTSTNQRLYAAGSLDSDVWIDSDGNTVVTPA